MNPLFAFRFECGRQQASHDVLMVFMATPSLDPEAFATLVEAEIEANLVPNEILVIVREPSFTKTVYAMKTESIIKATLGRLGQRATVSIVAYNRVGGECDRVHLIGPKSPRSIQFKDFRRRAVNSIFNKRRGFVESTETYHFENPSGRHTERFLRLSNILVRGAEIAFIGFCTLPYVPEGATVAYLDTPSLYAVVAAINEQRTSFDGIEPILADNFASYEGLVHYQFERLSEAFVLISGSSSGSLATALTRDPGFEPSRITHLLFLGNDKSNSNIVCDLQKCERANPDGVTNTPAVESSDNCKMCASGSFAIKLQGDQFEFAGPQQEPILIKKSDAPRNLHDLIGRTAGKNIFSIGLGRRTKPTQPRQYEVSPPKLLASKGFSDRLDYALRRSLPASLSHIIMADLDSKVFVEAIAEHAHGNVKIIRREDLDEIPSNTETAVVIAAAVIESGRSLLDISRDLRAVAPAAPLSYFIGFSKTTGEIRRGDLARHLVQTQNPYPYEFIEIEKMVLPVSAEHNAWSEELNLLIDPEVQAIASLQVKEWISKRINRLRKSSEAMTNELFVGNSPGRQLSLQPGFVFWPRETTEGDHSQAEVFFTIASVLQQLRANAQKVGKSSAIKSNWFQQTIFAPGNFGRFNDDIIQASILRAAYPHEMNYADSAAESEELGRLIRRIVRASHIDRGGAAAEFLLAIATQRLRLRSVDREAILSENFEKSPIVGFLRDLCRTRM
ncbi:hypothetical protein LP7551_03938 [Roseibium album]|nr:hypothetical protein LP7551_03938 [Roseibium album]